MPVLVPLSFAVISSSIGGGGGRGLYSAVVSDVRVMSRAQTVGHVRGLEEELNATQDQR